MNPNQSMLGQISNSDEGNFGQLRHLPRIVVPLRCWPGMSQMNRNTESPELALDNRFGIRGQASHRRHPLLTRLRQLYDRRLHPVKVLQSQRPLSLSMPHEYFWSARVMKIGQVFTKFAQSCWLKIRFQLSVRKANPNCLQTSPSPFAMHLLRFHS